MASAMSESLRRDFHDSFGSAATGVRAGFLTDLANDEVFTRWLIDGPLSRLRLPNAETMGRSLIHCPADLRRP